MGATRAGSDVDKDQRGVDASDVGLIRGEDSVASLGCGQGHVHLNDVGVGGRADGDADLLGAFSGQLVDDHRAAPGVARAAVTAGIPAGAAAVQPPRTRLGAYVASRQRKSAIGQYERALADQERMHGRDHPDTIAARATLAAALRTAGKMKNAIRQYERVLADRERIRGRDHPDTIVARANLAFAYRSAGRLREAVPAYERTLADRERVQGRDHQDTLTARANLAACYQLARRLTEAIQAYKHALADSERMRGPGDIETLTTRCNLASAYYIVGRLTNVVVILQRALTDCERYLRARSPNYRTVRVSLDAATLT